jgi:hypothetical protein
MGMWDFRVREKCRLSKEEIKNIYLSKSIQARLQCKLCINHRRI